MFQAPFGFVAILGVIALAGIIMRNSVILVDQIQQDTAAGHDPFTAIVESAVRRFRPITLTAAAAVLALIPLLGEVFWAPMALAMMGGLIAATISGPEHGFMKPSPTIFRAALQRAKVEAGEALMVGDSVRQDVEGALRAGMRAVLLHRGAGRHPEEEQLAARGVSIVRTLTELPAALTVARAQ